MTSDVSISSALQQQQNTNGATSSLAGDFTQFLTLLTTQLQNQDPLSPLETNEFTNQLVAFSGVEQQINTNQRLDSLVALQLTNSFTSALSYVGLDVSYISSEFNFDGATSSEITYALQGDAVEANISILNEDGDEVFSAEAATSGTGNFTWDGTLTGGGIAPPGTYQVRINALDIDGNGVPATTVVTGNVDGIETQNGSIFLLVGERAVAINSVLNASNNNNETTPAAEEEPPAEEGA